ncbi:MAG: hypothetical protein HOW97_12215 [Catenulispora sp.]|nr:hypothetical protein [Catenulispora sp.]
MRTWWGRLSGIQRAGAVVAAVIALGIIAALGHKSGSGSSGDKAAATPTTHAAASSPAGSPKATTPPASSHPAPGPTFTYPGDPECAITYRDRSDGSMSWTVRLSVPGELITHATDTGGAIYRHDVQAAAGSTSFSAPVPLAQVTDIGGNLRTSGGRSYGCSVAPAK